MQHNLRTFALFVQLILLFPAIAQAQTDTCLSATASYSIESEHLKELRSHWVSLPLSYDPQKSYPVIYLFDAEWRFELIRHVAFDLGGNKKTPGHIIVGIPHIEWEVKRSRDLTFSQSRMEYDGEAVDSTWYHAGNAGGARAFYQYLREELIPDVERNYRCNGQRILVGHSLGGYFGTYLLSEKEQPFSAMQLYDPSIWYSDGEVTERIKEQGITSPAPHVYISYQPEPAFHAQKIEALIETLRSLEGVSVEATKYNGETHNSLYLPSFLEGMKALYGK